MVKIARELGKVFSTKFTTLTYVPVINESTLGG